MPRLYVGSINTAGPWFRANGEGIAVCELDEVTGEFTRISTHSHVENALWMVRAGGNFLIATERYPDGGEIAAFDATFERIGVPRRTPGGALCHLALAPDQRTLYAVSYFGGVTAHALGADGSIGATRHEITYAGSGPDRDRQDTSHPHQAVVSPDGRYLLVSDLGCDRIWVHSLVGDIPGPPQGIAVHAGAGPRHLVFHPTLPRFYVLGELDCVVRLYEGQGATWTDVGSRTALPKDFSGTPGGAAIRLHPSGKTLTVSVRGGNGISDSVAVFGIDVQGGLAPAATFFAGGKSPRDIDFTPSGSQLVVLNQDSNNAIAFGFDVDTGLPTGNVGPPLAIGSPMCVIF